jgi:hypothetical protein
MFTVNCRKQVVRVALAGVPLHNDFHYLEVRPLTLHWPPLKNGAQVDADCSWYVKLVAWMAKIKDPTGFGFNSGYGNSADIYNNCKKISLGQIKPGDFVSFGPGGQTHIAIIVKVGANPTTVSDGRQGAPEIVTVQELANSIAALNNPALPAFPISYLRFPMLNRALSPSRKRVL